MTDLGQGDAGGGELETAGAAIRELDRAAGRALRLIEAAAALLDAGLGKVAHQEHEMLDEAGGVAELDRLASEPFMRKGRQQPPAPERDVFDDDVPA